MKGFCVALKELWGFLSASWLWFPGRKILQRSSSVGGSSVKQKPLHGPWGLALFPYSKATCLCMSPGEEELGGDNQCSRGLEQPGTAAGDGLPSVCLPPWPLSSSISPEPMFALDPGGFLFFSCTGAEGCPAVTSSSVRCSFCPRALHHHLAPLCHPLPSDTWAHL